MGCVLFLLGHPRYYSSIIENHLPDMMREGYISHPVVTSFWSWEPQPRILSALLVAVLTTILAYQVTATITDLLLGFKPSGAASTSDISTLLLSYQSTPLSVFAALSKGPLFSRWRFHGLRGSCPHQEHVSGRMRSSVLLKFFLLLVLAPLANLAAIVLTLEADSVLSFADVDFGGIALGYPETPTKFKLAPPGCRRAEFRLASLETPIASFYKCSASSSLPWATGPPFLVVENFDNLAILFRVVTDGMNYSRTVEGKLVIGEELFVIKEALNIEDGERLLHLGMNAARERCVPEDRNAMGGRQIQTGPPGAGPSGVAPPGDGFPVDGPPVDGPPVDGLPVDGPPVDGLPVDGPPVDGLPGDGLPVDGLPVTAPPGFASPISESLEKEIRGDGWRVRQAIDCENISPDVAKFLLSTLFNAVGFVDAEKIQLALSEVDGEINDDQSDDIDKNRRKFRQGGDKRFLKRTNGYISCAALCFTVLGVCTIRLFVRLFSNNDIDNGMELIFKNQIGIKCCDSALQSQAKVAYKGILEIERDCPQEKLLWEQSEQASSESNEMFH